MNIIGKLTLRHMMLNKKRTMVTVIGVIISVAMIMAVATIAYSFTSYLGEGAMEKTGEFHVVFEKVPYENRDIVLEGNNIDKSFYGKFIGDYNIKDIIGYEKNEREETAVVRVIGLEGDCFEKIYLGDIDGDYPANENEIMVSAWYSDSLNITEPGQKITMGATEYTVSGIYEAIDFETKSIDIKNQYTYAAFTYCSRNTIKDGDYINIYSKIYDLGNDIYDDIEEIGEKSGCEGWYDNKDVLYYYGIGEGNFGVVMNNIKYILIAVIMVGAIALIANGFSISLSERSRYLGMLASVGATKTQKCYSVFFEGFIIGIISIPLGILSGYIGTVITFKIIEDKIYSIVGADYAAPISVDVKPWVIIITVIFSVLTIFLSAYFPARRASKITPIDAIRQTKDIKITGKQVKTRKITGKIFGFEGELALKNLKRNKKKYAITVFSLAVSIVLFLTVYTFVYYLTNSAEMIYDNVNYDMYVDIYDNEDGTKFYNKIKKSENTETVSYQKYICQISILLDSNDSKKYGDSSFESYYRDFMNDGSELENFEVQFYNYDSDYIAEFLKEQGISYEEFQADKNNAIILNSSTERIYDETGTPKIYAYKYLNCSEGDKLTLLINHKDEKYYEDYYDESYQPDFGTEYKDEITLNVFGLSDSTPIGNMYHYSYYGAANCIPVIVTDELFNEIVQNAVNMSEDDNTVSYFVNEAIYFEGGNQEKLYNEITEINEEMGGNFWYYSVYQQKKEDSDMLFLIQVFTYGFIVLMTLVCAANIFNTISTSIALRKREFATLRSVGMTKKSFNKMIFYESGFYGIKALLYGIPASSLIIWFIYYNISSQFDSGFSLPWVGIIIAVMSVFIVIGSSMMYSSSKIKKENIIDGLKEENI